MSSSRIETLKKLLAKDPDSLLGRYGLAHEYYKLEMYDEAITAINEYLDVADDEGAVYRMLAECYVNTGEPQKARLAYVRGIEAANRHGHPGMAEEYEEAIEFLNE